MTKAVKEKTIAKNLIALILLVYAVLMFVKSLHTIMGGTIEDGLFALVYGVEGFLMMTIGFILKYMIIFK